MVRLWALIILGWMSLCAVIFVTVMWTMGLSMFASLMVALALTGVLLLLWTRDVPAKDLQMRESLWNTPDDSD